MNNSYDNISQPLRRLLKQYEITAMNSLRGPSFEQPSNSGLPFGASSSSASLSPIRPNAERPLTVEKFGMRDSLLDVLATISTARDSSGIVRPFPVQTMPVMTPRDHSTERHETLLEGEVISCFVVGGEKRLCLPQVLNTVLRDYSLQDINIACAELHIHRSQCSKEQLEILKVVGVLPVGSSNCGLITKTDAERLCNFLSYSRRRSRRNRLTISVAVSSSSTTSTTSSGEHRFSSTLPVYHECFGRCVGRYRDEKYTSLSAECIECEECGELYAPDRFVLHSHRNHETKTCHWGFDSANWRAYLHLPIEIEMVKEAKCQLENMKAKFQSVGGITKRAFDVAASSLPQSSSKRPRLEQLFDYPSSMNIQTPVPVQLTPQAPQSLPPLVLCDPLLVAYYHALANSRFNLCSTTAYPPSLLPLVSTLTVGGNDANEKRYYSSNGGGAPLTSAVEEAAAALLKLSPQTNSKDVGVQMEPKQKQNAVGTKSETTAPCVEPLKKHILHRSQSQLSVADDVCRRQVSSTKESSLETFNEDMQTIESLLCHYVNDPDGFKLIKSKLEETRRDLDGQLDSLTAQNRILQQEIAYLRNKQTNVSCGGAAVLTSVSPY